MEIARAVLRAAFGDLKPGVGGSRHQRLLTAMAGFGMHPPPTLAELKAIRADPGMRDALTLGTQREAVDEFVRSEPRSEHPPAFELREAAGLLFGMPVCVDFGREGFDFRNEWAVSLRGATVTHTMCYGSMLDYAMSRNGTWASDRPALPGLLSAAERVTGVLPLGDGPLAEFVIRVLSRAGVLDVVVWHAVCRRAPPPLQASSGALGSALARALLTSVRAAKGPVPEAGTGAILGLVRALRALPPSAPALGRALRGYLMWDADHRGGESRGSPKALTRLQLACSSHKGCNPSMLLVAVAQLPERVLPPVAGGERAGGGAWVRVLAMVVAGELLAHRMWSMTDLLGAEKALGCFSFGAEVGAFAVTLPDRLRLEAQRAVAVTRLLLSGLDAVFRRPETLAAAVDAGGEHGLQQACLEAAAFGTHRADAAGTRLAPPPSSAAQERSAALALRTRLLKSRNKRESVP